MISGAITFTVGQGMSVPCKLTAHLRTSFPGPKGMPTEFGLDGNDMPVIGGCK
jgi:hypothetical protein